MIDTTSMAVGTGALVTVGRWAQGDGLSVNVVIGATFFAVGLAVLPQEIGEKFAVVVLIIAVLTYVPQIAFKAGLIDHQPPVWKLGKPKGVK